MMNAKVSDNFSSEPDAHKPGSNKLLGVYPQKQDGLFMQRIKISGGRINWHQWRKIALLAAEYSRGFPLHITTRQDIELHNLDIDDIPIIHEGLSKVALTTFSTGGDSIRNMTICSGCDFHRDGFDLLPLAQLVWQHLKQQRIILNLPRKFKISFSGCRKACAKPWLSDLGFIAQRDGLLSVIGAGSLGPRPSPGIKLYDDLPAKHVLPLCVAALEFFEQHGDRKNRHRARFRHIREKFGDQSFKAELDARFDRLKVQKAWPDISPAPSRNRNMKLLSRLQLPNGNISPQTAIELADAAEPHGAILRINIEHGLELYSTEEIQLPGSLVGLVNNPIIIACPGSTTCPGGLVNCWATADKIRNTFTNGNTRQLRICISGCPNNCALSAVADIGLVGITRKENGKPSPNYRLFTGGGNGENEKLAVQSSIISVSEICDSIKSFIGGLS